LAPRSRDLIRIARLSESCFPAERCLKPSILIDALLPSHFDGAHFATPLIHISSGFNSADYIELYGGYSDKGESLPSVARNTSAVE